MKTILFLPIVHSLSVTSANIAINDIALKLDSLDYIFCHRQHRPIFNFDVIGPKAIEFGETAHNKGHYAVQGTNRKPICDFVLVINTNLHSISHPFQVIADYW